MTMPLAEFLNSLQLTGGLNVDQALLGFSYFLGMALKQRGAIINPDAPLKEALPLLVSGYEQETERALTVPRASLAHQGGKERQC